MATKVVLCAFIALSAVNFAMNMSGFKHGFFVTIYDSAVKK